MNQPYAVQPQPIFEVQPFVVQALQSLLGQTLVLETPRGSLSGALKDVKPDHVVVQGTDGNLYFVAVCHIIWIMPVR
ncbi:YuzF family protein [Paenibacillus sp. S-38]|uniref:YuzF family protein n=1 Tax=Paenibacillus sp. S-38 TaxID=3416710 RepID=UPI003CF94912